MTLTIGMATYDDFDGVFFTIQGLRMMHKFCQTDEVEFIVLDNNHESKHGEAVKHFLNSVPNSKYITLDSHLSTFNKYKISDYATSEYVLIMDCHVLIEIGGIDALLNYYSQNPNSKNLIQGPLLYDDLNHMSTNFGKRWSGNMYGVWETDLEKYNLNTPFEIDFQGMGLLSYKLEHWPGINQNFKGFGAEEWYIAEKFRQGGGKNICIPQLRWNHRFGRPEGAKYPLILEDRIWNYFVGWLELYKYPEHPLIVEAIEYFSTKLPRPLVLNILNKAIKLYT